MSIAEKLEAARQAASMKKEVKDTTKETPKRKEIEKEECPFCGKKYTPSRINSHMKDCPENPENETIVNLPNAPFLDDMQKKIDDIVGENAKLRQMIEELQSTRKKRVSASTVYSEMIAFLTEHPENPVYAMLLKNCTDTKRHWRSIVINAIDALFEMGYV